MLKPAVRGLDISWRTDVTSKQERYVVSYTRNDTGAVSTQTTTDRGFSIEGLYPGAGYRVQVGIYPSNIIIIMDIVALWAFALQIYFTNLHVSNARDVLNAGKGCVTHIFDFSINSKHYF